MRLRSRKIQRKSSQNIKYAFSHFNNENNQPITYTGFRLKIPFSTGFSVIQTLKIARSQDKNNGKCSGKDTVKVSSSLRPIR